jgi:broad specificity phosphatase PhoE
MQERLQRPFYVLATVLAAVALFLGSALPAWAAEAMTLTLVRHGGSEANAAGVIDTSVPGPHLTELGRQQAAAVADALAANNYDGVYASSMIRTQETAAPMAERLGQPIVILPGLREIGAGVFEGSSANDGLGRLGYALPPVAWTLGARFVPVLGAEDGNAFDARVDDAIQTIYDGGDRNAVAFSHGATIMFWVMMNVDNPDLGLLLSHQLGNTAVVVVTGNPEDGWTLENWDGVEVAAQPSLATKLFVDVRDVVTAPQTAAYRIGKAFATGDIAAVANAIRDGVVDVATKVIGFVPKVVGDVVGSLQGSAPAQSDPAAWSNPMTLDAAPKTQELGSAKRSTSEPDTTTVAKKTEPSNGATDLSDGNKVEPDKTATTSHKGDQSGDVVTEITPVKTENDASADQSETTADADAAKDSGSAQQAAA